jgi:hypothetical protein
VADYCFITFDFMKADRWYKTALSMHGRVKGIQSERFANAEVAWALIAIIQSAQEKAERLLDRMSSYINWRLADFTKRNNIAASDSNINYKSLITPGELKPRISKSFAWS